MTLPRAIRSRLEAAPTACLVRKGDGQIRGRSRWLAHNAGYGTARFEASQPRNRCLSKSFTNFGLAFPWVPFITCPTKKPKSFSLPVRYSFTSFG